MSGRCDPPAAGSFVTYTVPGGGRGCAASTPRMDSGIAPRWTGMYGALVTRSPAASNTAQEKSSRSRMFVDSAVRWSTTPICWAITEILCPSTSRSTGSLASRASPVATPPSSRTSNTPPSATSATNPTSSTIVPVASTINAGPRTTPRTASRRHTGTARHAPSSHSRAVSGAPVSSDT
jgi:hypothetical protein